MAKRKNSAFVCSDCGADYSKWQGQCSDCGAWNTVVEFRLGPAAPRGVPTPVGGGYSGLDGAFFNGIYSTRNFLGRGQVVSAAVQVGKHCNKCSRSFCQRSENKR